MSRPRLDPRESARAEEREGEARARLEVPEWMQREAEAVTALRRRETLRLLILPAILVAVLAAGGAAVWWFAP